MSVAERKSDGGCKYKELEHDCYSWSFKLF